MRMIWWAVLVGLVAVAGGPTAAQDEKAAPAKDKPAAKDKADQVPGPYRGFVVSGERKGRFRDLVTSRDLYPTLAVFAREMPKGDDHLVKLLGVLEAEVAARRNEHLGAFAAFLAIEGEVGDDRVAAEIDFLSEAKRAAREPLVAEADALAKKAGINLVPLALDFATSPQARAMGLNLNPGDVTVIFYNRHRVQNRWEFTKDKPLDDKAVGDDKNPGEIVATVRKAIIPPRKK